MNWVWQQDCFTQADSIPLTDRGFRYGMSVFETVLLHEGAPVFFDQHLQRLRAACAQCGFTAPSGSLEQIEKTVRGRSKQGLARIYVTGGDGLPVAPFENCRVAIFVEERTRDFAEGYALTMDHGKHRPLFSGLKTGNYWSNIAALMAARGSGRDEAILLNGRGEIISACLANIFAVVDGALVTPHIGSGARNGVVREWVTQRRDVDQRAITIADLTRATEIFLTNSWLGVMPATSLEDRALPSNVVASALRDEFEKFLTCG